MIPLLCYVRFNNSVLCCNRVSGRAVILDHKAVCYYEAEPFALSIDVVEKALVKSDDVAANKLCKRKALHQIELVPDDSSLDGY